MDKTDYNKQALEFLQKTGTTLTIRKQHLQIPRKQFTFNHITGYNYEVTLRRKGKEYIFIYTDSIDNRKNRRRPSDYDILACLNYEEFESIDDFVDMFGYNEAPISEVLDTYNAVIDQNLQLKRLYTEKELARLAEIN